jgi:hypothetical protein
MTGTKQYWNYVVPFSKRRRDLGREASPPAQGRERALHRGLCRTAQQRLQLRDGLTLVLPGPRANLRPGQGLRPRRLRRAGQFLLHKAHRLLLVDLNGVHRGMQFNSSLYDPGLKRAANQGPSPLPRRRALALFAGNDWSS